VPTAEPEPPMNAERTGWSEFRTGWRALLASFVGVMIGLSSSYFFSVGMFLKPMAADLGLSRGAASLGPLLCSLCAAALSPFLGRIVDQLGPARLAVASCALLGVAYLAMGWLAHDLTSFLALSLVIAVCGAGSTSVTFSRLVVAQFDMRRTPQ